MSALWKILCPWHKDDAVQKQVFEETRRQAVQVMTNIELVARRAESVVANEQLAVR